MATEKNDNDAEAPAPDDGAYHLGISVELSKLAERLPALVPHLRSAIGTPFPDSFHPSEKDAFAAQILLWEIAHAVSGMGRWDGIRDAYRALVAGRGLQDRYAAAVARCDWAIGEWKHLDRRGRRGETAAKKRERLQALRPLEDAIVRTLKLALVDQESGFSKVSDRSVRGQLATAATRANASGVGLLLRLKCKDAWPELTRKAIDRALDKKRQAPP